MTRLSTQLYLQKLRLERALFAPLFLLTLMSSKTNAAGNPSGFSASLNASYSFASFSTRPYSARNVISQDVLESKSGIGATAGFRWNKNILNVYGAWADARYECKGKIVFITRESRGDTTDTAFQEKCSGTYSRLGLSYSYMIRARKSVVPHVTFGIGYQWHRNDMTLGREAPRSYDDPTLVTTKIDVTHQRTGPELMFEYGMDWPINEHLFLGPIIGFSFSKDDSLLIENKHSELGKEDEPFHYWVSGGFKLSYR